MWHTIHYTACHSVQQKVYSTAHFEPNLYRFFHLDLSKLCISLFQANPSYLIAITEFLVYNSI